MMVNTLSRAAKIPRVVVGVGVLLQYSDSSFSLGFFTHLISHKRLKNTELQHKNFNLGKCKMLGSPRNSSFTTMYH